MHLKLQRFFNMNEHNDEHKKITFKTKVLNLEISKFVNHK